LTVAVDHRLDGALWEAFDLAVHHLHGAIDDPLLQAFVEDEIEGLRQVFPHVLRVLVRQAEVHEVSDLDRLRFALVGHATSVSRQLDESARYTSIISTSPDATAGSSVSGPAMAARAASRGQRPSATSRPAAISTRVDATSRRPAVSMRRIACANRT